MIKFIEPFGYHIDAGSVGEAWLDLLEAIVAHGDKTFDEGRARLSLQNVRIRLSDFRLPDPLIEKYGDKEKIDGIVYLTFKGEEMYDFDVVPSFSPGARSYYARIKEGRMDEYVVKRLTNIPESKKGVISFIHWDDYKAVLDTPFDDYLPCILTVQLRMLERGDGYVLNTIFNARSLDAFQKGNGNLIAIGMLAGRIARRLEENLGKSVEIGSIDGLVTDAHVYDECLADARHILLDNKKHGESR